MEDLAFIFACITADLQDVKTHVAHCHRVQGQKALKAGFEAACCHGRVEIIEYLLNQANIFQPSQVVNEDGLLMACANGHREVVELLWTSLKSPHDLLPEQKKKAVLSACEADQLEIVMYFLETPAMWPEQGQLHQLLSQALIKSHQRNAQSVMNYLVYSQHIEVSACLEEYMATRPDLATRLECRHLNEHLNQHLPARKARFSNKL